MPFNVFNWTCTHVGSRPARPGAAPPLRGSSAPGTYAKLKSLIASAASVPSFARKRVTFPLSSG